MSNLFSAVIFGVMSLLAACSSAQVEMAKAPDLNLSQYKTYAWAPGGALNSQPISIQEQTIKSAVDRQLAKQGLVHAANPSSADLLVYYSMLSQLTAATPRYNNYGWDWGGGAPVPEREATLSLQLVDAKKNKEVWNGSATERFDSKSDSSNHLTEAVSDLFEKFPTG